MELRSIPTKVSKKVYEKNKLTWLIFSGCIDFFLQLATNRQLVFGALLYGI